MKPRPALGLLVAIGFIFLARFSAALDCGASESIAQDFSRTEDGPCSAAPPTYFPFADSLVSCHRALQCVIQGYGCVAQFSILSLSITSAINIVENGVVRCKYSGFVAGTARCSPCGECRSKTLSCQMPATPVSAPGT